MEQFIYTGQSRIPQHVTRVFIDGSIDTIERSAFLMHPNIEEVVCHVNIKRIKESAFDCCRRLRRIVMPGVTDVENGAFWFCDALTDVECGMLETIEYAAFIHCKSLSSIDLSSARIVKEAAFQGCKALTCANFSAKLEQIYALAFASCTSLEQITVPFAVLSSWVLHGVKGDHPNTGYVVIGCKMLKHVHLIEEEALRETVAALQLEAWRDDMNEEIDAINLTLPNARAGYYRDVDDCEDEDEKTDAIYDWIKRVREKLVSYTSQHRHFLNETATMLELALRKKSLCESDKASNGVEGAAVVADRAIKQEPDNAVSTAFDEDTVIDEFHPEDFKSTDNAVSTAFDEDMVIDGFRPEDVRSTDNAGAVSTAFDEDTVKDGFRPEDVKSTDNAVSTAFDEDTVKDEFRPEDVKCTAIPVVVKTEVTKFRTAYDEDTDDEDSTSKVEAEESITCHVKKRKVEAAASVPSRAESRVTNVVIKNVLSFLELPPNDLLNTEDDE